MPIYAYDEGYNKHEVASSDALDTLEAVVETKQTLLNMTQGSEQSDYNTLSDTGIYYMPVTAANKPSNTNYILFVAPIDNSASAVMQIAYSIGGTLMYTRVYSSGTWSPWMRWATYESVQQVSVQKTWSGITEPVASTGKNGDLYCLIGNTGIDATYVKINNNWMKVESQQTYSGISAPNNDLGSNGDLYFKVTVTDSVISVVAIYTKIDEEWIRSDDITYPNLTTANKTLPAAVNELASIKQNSTDNSLSTTSKTIPGAINELNSKKQDSLYCGTLSNTDFNTVRANGYYWVGTGNTNIPVSGTYGYLEVINTYDSSTSAMMQRFTRFGNDSASTRGDVYVRFYANNQWYSWNKIAQLIT